MLISAPSTLSKFGNNLSPPYSNRDSNYIKRSREITCEHPAGFSRHPRSVSCISTSRQLLAIKVRGSARTVHYEDSDVFVFLEPGMDEIFVSELELREKLMGTLRSWPKELPDDLSRFETLDDAVSYLLGSACELELGPGLGSIQWFQVRLEA